MLQGTAQVRLVLTTPIYVYTCQHPTPSSSPGHFPQPHLQPFVPHDKVGHDSTNLPCCTCRRGTARAGGGRREKRWLHTASISSNMPC